MPAINLDFDGVLHSYPEWKGETVIDDPVEGAQDFVAELLNAGFQVNIVSTRARTPAGRRAIQQWFKEHNFPPDWKPKIGYEKLMSVLNVDDRGYRFDGDFDKLLEFTKTSMEPWNRPSKSSE